MLISGIQPFTMLDYPGKTACVVFTAGCQFRCGYCHNPEFVLPELLVKIKGDFITEEAFFNFLDERRGLLEGVVVSGGEPTIHHDLFRFIQKIKAAGFLVKLDTNGNRPDVLEAAIEDGLLDYVAMDVKTSLSGYPDLVGKLAKPESIRASIELLKTSSVEHEFRCTLIKEVHCDTIVAEMIGLLAGAKRLYLQEFRPGHTLDPAYQNYHAFSSNEVGDIAERFRAVVSEVIVRS